jgi:CBS domain-containing protein
MNVREAMTSKVVAVQPGTSVKGTAQALLDNGVSGVPVLDDEGRLVGIVSEADLLPKESLDGGLFGPGVHVIEGSSGEDVVGQTRRALALRARDLMSSPVHTTSPNVSLREAARRMAERHIRRMPVVENGKLVGILTVHDVLKAFASSDAATGHDVELALERGGVAPPRHCIDVQVTDGVVELRGTTNGSDSLLHILATVRAVDGVVAIRDDITVEFEAS